MIHLVTPRGKVTQSIKAGDWLMLQGFSSWAETLSNVLDNCPQLHTLDVSSLQSPITDSFLADLCDRALELRHLGIYVGPVGSHRPVGCELLVAVVRVCPSLAQLWLAVPADSGKFGPAEVDVVDTVVDAVRQYHGGLCHRRDVSLSSGNCHQIQLTFTPLKLVGAVADCPYLS